MALVPYQGFVGGANSARSKNFDAETCLNLFAEMAAGTAKSVAALYGTPGLEGWANLADGPIRGMLRFNKDVLYVVSGQSVYKVLHDPVSFSIIGSLTFAQTPVSLASNGIQVMIATNPDMFVIDTATDTVTQIVDPDFLGAIQVSFISGYFVWNVPNTGRAQYSNLYSTNIDTLSFFTAEASPDNGVGQIVDHLEYWYFNETTTEVFSITDDPDQPLQRIQGAVIEHGCAAAYSIAKMDNTIYWLGTDDNGQGTVWRASGAYEPQRVSTPAIEYAISQTADLSGSVAWVYQMEGHAFYILTAGERTWCFDASTNLWHERAWRNTSTGQMERHRANTHAFFGNRHIVGDWESGLLYVLSMDFYSDLGEQIVARRTGPYVSAKTFNMLQVDFETGVAGDPPFYDNPVVQLQWSDDGGNTWSNNHQAELGRVGEYQLRVRWRRLGTPRRFGLSRVFRVTVASAVKKVITGAMLDIS